MATYEFDAFLDSMGSAVDGAQESIDRKNQARLQRLFEEGKDGKTTAVTWVCNLPSDKGGEREQISLPLLSLHSSQSFHIAEVSLEFDAEVAPFNGREADASARRNEGNSRKNRLVMWLRKWKRVPRRGLARIKVICQGGDVSEGEVSVNGQRLKKFKCRDE